MTNFQIVTKATSITALLAIALINAPRVFSMDRPMDATPSEQTFSINNFKGSMFTYKGENDLDADICMLNRCLMLKKSGSNQEQFSALVNDFQGLPQALSAVGEDQQFDLLKKLHWDKIRISNGIPERSTFRQ